MIQKDFMRPEKTDGGGVNKCACVCLVFVKSISTGNEVKVQENIRWLTFGQIQVVQLLVGCWGDTSVKISQLCRLDKQQIQRLSGLDESLASWTRLLSPCHPKREKWLKHGWMVTFP